jgi:uncharacterized protein
MRAAETGDHMPNNSLNPQQNKRTGRRSVLAFGAGFAILATAAVTSAVLRSVRRDDAASGATAVIMVIGDSLADGLANGLRRLDPRHRRYTVRNETRIASGLVEHDAFDWPTALGTLMQEQRPVAIVVLNGLNDARSDFASFGSVRWEENYRARIAAMLEITERASIPTIWIGLPVMRDPELNRRAMYLDRLYSDEVSREKDARFIDLRSLTGGSDFSYKPFLPGENGSLQRFRETDGIHFTTFGYDVVADRVAREINLAGVAGSQFIGSFRGDIVQRSRRV